MIILAYRAYYTDKTPKLTSSKTKFSLQSELENLQNELQNLQQRKPVMQHQNTNYFELDQFLTNKFILIAGCILLGAGIAYLFLNTKKRC